MIWNKLLEGKYVTLRSVIEDDAEVTMELRLRDKEKTKFLHQIDNNMERQRDWIRSQNKADDDYFFLVLDKKGTPIGTMGICDIEPKRGYIGRILMYGNAFESYEAYILLNDFGFFELGLDEMYGETDIENKSAMRFTEMYGYTFGDVTYDPKLDRYIRICTATGNDFLEAKKKLEKMIYRNR